MRIIKTTSLTKQTQLNMALFLVVAINGLLGELGNRVNESLTADNLAIYITTRNQKVATRAMQGVTNNRLDT